MENLKSHEIKMSLDKNDSGKDFNLNGFSISFIIKKDKTLVHAVRLRKDNKPRQKKNRKFKKDGWLKII